MKKAGVRISRLSQFERAHTRKVANLETLGRLDELLNNTHEWSSKMALENPKGDTVALYTKLKQRRESLLGEIDKLEEPTKEHLALPAVPPRFGQLPDRERIRAELAFIRYFQQRTSDRGRTRGREAPSQRFVVGPARQVMPGCEEPAQTCPSTLNKQKVLWAPVDLDTQSDLSIEFGSMPGFDTMRHRTEIKDTYAGLYDPWARGGILERYHYWAVLGFELKKADCDYLVNWWGIATHNVVLWGTAPYRRLETHWLRYPREKEDTYPGRDPAALEDFDRLPGWSQTNGASTSVYDNWGLTLRNFPDSDLTESRGGTFVVRKGQIPRVWIGLEVSLSVWAGNGGTGRNHLTVTDGHSLPGVLYQMMALR